jgi:hypothetical protein
VVYYHELAAFARQAEGGSLHVPWMRRRED